MLLSLLASGVFADEVFVIPLHGEISDAQFMFVRRALKEAEESHASAVILDMDTYGGALNAATKMHDALFKMRVPTLTYIDTNAGSAGALVALCTQQIYMAPVSAIGAAAPVMSGGQNLPTTMNDKIVSYFSGYFRSAAQRNGYNPDIAEAFISKDAEVKIGDVVVHPKGTLLTLSAQEATRVINGKPVLASGMAASLEEVLNKSHHPGTLHRVEASGFERLAFWVTEFSPIFLLIGIVGAYLEFKMHGTMIPGTMAAIAFLIFFGGHYLAGLAGWEVVAVFVVGVALVLSELLLHPGTVIPGVTGVMLMIGALLWAMIDRYPGQPFWPTAPMLYVPLAKLGGALAAAIIVIIMLGKMLPRSMFYNRLVLARSNPSGPSFSPATVASPTRVPIGAEGIAKSMLRPSGNAQFGDFLVDVVTRGEFVERSSPLRVLAVEGARIVVEELK